MNQEIWYFGMEAFKQMCKKGFLAAAFFSARDTNNSK
jgi:hypothetical protein